LTVSYHSVKTETL